MNLYRYQAPNLSPMNFPRAACIVIAAQQLAKLSQLPNIVSAEYNSPLLVIKSNRGTNNLETVLDFIKKEGIQHSKIYSELPTLNDVFLELTGKELRD
jgi:ABC-2 type transport system ATP-binding protein